MPKNRQLEWKVYFIQVCMQQTFIYGILFILYKAVRYGVDTSLHDRVEWLNLDLETFNKNDYVIGKEVYLRSPIQKTNSDILWWSITITQPQKG